MQELSNSIKIPNLRIMGIEEGKEVQSKGILNMVNEIKTENFPSLEKYLPIKVWVASRTLNRLDQNRISPGHIIIKTTNAENREIILKAVREKKEITYDGKPIKIKVDFPIEALKQKGMECDILGTERKSFHP
jgi:hypothetical protein